LYFFVFLCEVPFYTPEEGTQAKLQQLHEEPAAYNNDVVKK